MEVVVQKLVHASGFSTITLSIACKLLLHHQKCFDEWPCKIQAFNAPKYAQLLALISKSMASGHLKIKKGLVLYLYWPLGVTLMRVYNSLYVYMYYNNHNH